MSRTSEAKRIAALLVLAMMALLLALSTLDISDAEARKRHHRINTVLCPNQPGTANCVGTDSREKLIGRNFAFDRIEGKEGNDIYDGKSGSDIWEDSSATSTDLYLVSVKEFSSSSGLGIRDRGGSQDTLDLSRFYKSFEFDFSMDDRDFDGIVDDLVLDGPGVNNVVVLDFGNSNSVDHYKFADRTLTADQVRGLLQ